jgi:hypothetical protein
LKQHTLEHFQRYLSLGHSPETVLTKFEATTRKILGIGREVLLTKKLHDIVDELRMMSRIFLFQEQVTSDFIEHLRNIYEQEQNAAGRMTAEEELLDGIREIKELLREKSGRPGTSDVHLLAAAESTCNRKIPPQSIASPISLPMSSISESTLQRASRVFLNIGKRRNELEELESATDTLLDQVCGLSLFYHSSRRSNFVSSFSLADNFIAQRSCQP